MYICVCVCVCRHAVLLHRAHGQSPPHPTKPTDAQHLPPLFDPPHSPPPPPRPKHTHTPYTHTHTHPYTQSIKKAAREALSDPRTFVKGPDYKEKFSFVFGDGLVTSVGEKHKTDRALFAK